MSAWENIYQKAQKQAQGVKDIQEFNILLKYHYKSEGKWWLMILNQSVQSVNSSQELTLSLSHIHPQINLR